MSESGYWGYHLLIDCSRCEIPSITNSHNIYNFTKTLVERIDMKAYGEPIIEHFATHDIDKAGYSLVQLIETSNITAHFVDKNGDCYIDIFSCKPFSEKIAVECVEEFFNPEHVITRFLNRQARGIA
jgi:S-adenosylmethionine/arginine decarboxylase-like enzyme